MFELILASKSKVRKKILDENDFNVQVQPSTVDEEPIKQSERTSIHKNYIKRLLETGAAYRCFTSESEIIELRENFKFNYR